MLSLNVQGTAQPKQIVVTAATSGQIMYTVPAGRTFEGFYFSSSSSPSISINAVVLPFAGYESRPIKLVSGTVVACASSTPVNLLGVEN